MFVGIFGDALFAINATLCSFCVIANYFHFCSVSCCSHALNKLVPETRGSRLVQETCTCVRQSVQVSCTQ